MSAGNNRKRNQKDRKFRPSARTLWSTVPSEEIPSFVENPSNDRLCEKCYFYLKRRYPRAQLIVSSARKHRKAKLAETFPPHGSSVSSSPLVKSGNLSQVIDPDMIVPIPVSEWIRLVEAAPCCAAVGKEMFRTRPGCTGKILFQGIETEGKFVLMKTKCDQCGERINFFNSSSDVIRKNPRKKGKGYRIINVKTVASVMLLEQGSYACYSRKLATTEGSKISEGAWKRIEKIVWRAVDRVAEETYQQVAQELQERKEKLMIAGDGAWSQRRNALHGTYSILDVVSGK